MKSLEVRNIALSVNRKTILNNINFYAEPGKWVSIVGPNGAGKSSIVKILARVWRADRGKIFVWGKEISQYKNKGYANHIGFLFSEPENLFDIKVSDYIKLGLYRKTSIFSFYGKKYWKDFDFAVNVSGTENLLSKSVTSLSQGELQRIRLARIICQNPSIFVFDEPLSHLDISHRLYFINLISRLKATGKTIIMVEHDLSIVYHKTDYFLLLKQGKAIKFNKKENLSLSDFNNTFEVKFKFVNEKILTAEDI